MIWNLQFGLFVTTRRSLWILNLILAVHRDRHLSDAAQLYFLNAPP